MLIKKKKNLVSVYLADFPTKQELEILAQYGTFELDEKRKYKRLLQYIPQKDVTSLVMECPIRQWFTI